MSRVSKIRSLIFSSARASRLSYKSLRTKDQRIVSWNDRSSREFEVLHCKRKQLLQTHSSATTQQEAVKPKQIAKFCSVCGGHIELQKPEGELEIRHVCQQCGNITYYNPKMVVGVICEHEGKILLCRRAIEPCKGFMEMGESTAEGAVRETLEEACASVEIVAPYVHFDIPRIGQAYILFRAKLLPPFNYGASEESLEVDLFSPDGVPFDQLAFSSISLALRFYADESRHGVFRMHHGVVEKREGSSPNDPSSYYLRDHMSFSLS